MHGTKVISVPMTKTIRDSCLLKLLINDEFACNVSLAQRQPAFQRLCVESKTTAENQAVEKIWIHRLSSCEFRRTQTSNRMAEEVEKTFSNGDTYKGGTSFDEEKCLFIKNSHLCSDVTVVAFEIFSNARRQTTRLWCLHASKRNGTFRIRRIMCVESSWFSLRLFFF